MATKRQVDIRFGADYTQFERGVKAMEAQTRQVAGKMSDALNGAIGGKAIISSINTINTSLGQISQATKASSKDFDNLDYSVGKFSEYIKVAEKDVVQLQKRILQQESFRQMERNLKSIAVAANFSGKEVLDWGKKLGVAEDSIAKVAKQIKSLDIGRPGSQLVELAEKIKIPEKEFDVLLAKIKETTKSNALEELLNGVAISAGLSAQKIEEYGRSLGIADEAIKRVVESVHKVEFDSITIQLNKLQEIYKLTGQQAEFFAQKLSESDRIKQANADFERLAVVSGYTREGLIQLGQQFGASTEKIQEMVQALHPLDAAIVDIPIDELTQELTQLVGKLNLTETEFTDLYGRIKSSREIDSAKKDFEQLAQEAKLVGQEFYSMGKRFNLAEKDIKDVERAIKGTSKELQFMKGVMRSAITYGAAYFGAHEIVQFGKDVFKATQEVRQLGISMEAITGSASMAATEMAFVRDVADEIGLNFYDLIGRYKNFSASARQMNMSLEDQHKILLGLSKASATYGLASQQVEGAFLAIEQMAAKGTLSMEEVRRQLGDHLPGAMAMMAKSVGMTNAAFIKFVESGQAAANYVLPKFADELLKLNGTLDESIQASNKASEAWKDFKAALGESGFQDVAVAGLQGVAWWLNNITDALTLYNDMQKAQGDADLQKMYTATQQWMKKISNLYKAAGLDSVFVIPDNIDPDNQEMKKYFETLYQITETSKNIKRAQEQGWDDVVKVQEEKMQELINSAIEQGSKFKEVISKNFHGSGIFFSEGDAQKTINDLNSFIDTRNASLGEGLEKELSMMDSAYAKQEKILLESLKTKKISVFEYRDAMVAIAETKSKEESAIVKKYADKSAEEQKKIQEDLLKQYDSWRLDQFDKRRKDIAAQLAMAEQRWGKESQLYKDFAATAEYQLNLVLLDEQQFTDDIIAETEKQRHARARAMMPYDPEAVTKERQALEDEINKITLDGQLKVIDEKIANEKRYGLYSKEEAIRLETEKLAIVRKFAEEQAKARYEKADNFGDYLDGRLAYEMGLHKDATERQLEMYDEMYQDIADFGQETSKALGKTLKDFIKTGEADFKGLADSLKDQAMDLVADLAFILAKEAITINIVGKFIGTEGSPSSSTSAVPSVETASGSAAAIEGAQSVSDILSNADSAAIVLAAITTVVSDILNKDWASLVGAGIGTIAGGALGTIIGSYVGGMIFDSAAIAGHHQQAANVQVNGTAQGLNATWGNVDFGMLQHGVNEGHGLAIEGLSGGTVKDAQMVADVLEKTAATAFDVIGAWIMGLPSGLDDIISSALDGLTLEFGYGVAGMDASAWAVNLEGDITDELTAASTAMLDVIYTAAANSIGDALENSFLSNEISDLFAEKFTLFGEVFKNEYDGLVGMYNEILDPSFFDPIYEAMSANLESGEEAFAGLAEWIDSLSKVAEAYYNVETGIFGRQQMSGFQQTMLSVENQFDTLLNSLEELGFSAEYIAKVEAERTSYLEEQAQAILDASKESLSLRKASMGGTVADELQYNIHQAYSQAESQYLDVFNQFVGLSESYISQISNYFDALESGSATASGLFETLIQNLGPNGDLVIAWLQQIRNEAQLTERILEQQLESLKTSMRETYEIRRLDLLGRKEDSAWMSSVYSARDEAMGVFQSLFGSGVYEGYEDMIKNYFDYMAKEDFVKADSVLNRLLGGDPNTLGLAEKFPDMADEVKLVIDWLNLLRIELDQLAEAEAKYWEQATEDLQVRILEAQGLERTAGALSLAYEHEREYAEAVEEGADAAYLAYLSTAQAAESLAYYREQAEKFTAFHTDLIVRYYRATGQNMLADLAEFSASARDLLQEAASWDDSAMAIRTLAAERLELLASYDEEAQAAADYAEALDSATKSVTDTIDNLKVTIKDWLNSLEQGSLSVLNPRDKLAAAAADFQSQYALALEGDASAISSITGYADAYLQAGQDMYASSMGYQDIYAEVTRMMEELPDAISKDDMIAKTIEDQTSAITDAVDYTTVAVESLRSDIKDLFRSITSSGNQALEEWYKYTGNMPDIDETSWIVFFRKFPEAMSEMTELLGLDNPFGGGSEQEIKAVFQALDLNANNLLDLNELIIGGIDDLLAPPDTETGIDISALNDFISGEIDVNIDAISTTNDILTDILDALTSGNEDWWGGSKTVGEMLQEALYWKLDTDYPELNRWAGEMIPISEALFLDISAALWEMNANTQHYYKRLDEYGNEVFDANGKNIYDSTGVADLLYTSNEWLKKIYEALSWEAPEDTSAWEAGTVFSLGKILAEGIAAPLMGIAHSLTLYMEDGETQYSLAEVLSGAFWDMEQGTNTWLGKISSTLDQIEANTSLMMGDGSTEYSLAELVSGLAWEENGLVGIFNTLAGYDMLGQKTDGGIIDVLVDIYSVLNESVSVTLSSINERLYASGWSAATWLGDIWNKLRWWEEGNLPDTWHNLFGITAMAGGGYLPANTMAWVGEEGPEIITPSQPARIYPTDYFSAAPASGGNESRTVAALEQIAVILSRGQAISKEQGDQMLTVLKGVRKGTQAQAEYASRQ